jgi:hypothetical protein
VAIENGVICLLEPRRWRGSRRQQGWCRNRERWRKTVKVEKPGRNWNFLSQNSDKHHNSNPHNNTEPKKQSLTKHGCATEDEPDYRDVPWRIRRTWWKEKYTTNQHKKWFKFGYGVLRLSTVWNWNGSVDRERGRDSQLREREREVGERVCLGKYILEWKRKRLKWLLSSVYTNCFPMHVNQISRSEIWSTADMITSPNYNDLTVWIDWSHKSRVRGWELG